MDLNDYRTRIDQIDDQLVKLFAERMETVVGIAKYKEEHNLPVLDASARSCSPWPKRARRRSANTSCRCTR